MLPSADSAHSVPDRCRTGLAGQYGLAAQAAARPRSRGHCDLRPWPGTPAVGARLGKLVTGGALADASRAASQQGLGILIRVGPLGDLPGTAELVRISFLDPPTREDGVRVTRWEATGPPAACSRSCTVTSRSPRPASSQHGWHSRASTAAAGPRGASLDRAVLHRVADATIRALLRTVADAVTSPAVAPAARKQTLGGLPARPATEPGSS